MNWAWGAALALAGAAGAFGLSQYALPLFLAADYEQASARDTERNDRVVPFTPPDARPVVRHVPLPEAVKAAYMTSCAVATPSFRAHLESLIRDTELNAIVIDIKDYSGTISFPPSGPSLQDAWRDARCGAADMRAYVAHLHDLGIYVIGRITVFQDPYYAVRRPDLAVAKRDGSVWKDFKGLSFIDVGAEEYWDRIVELSAESYDLGFDELNFDYVRYPSDGPMDDIAFPHTGAVPKPAKLEEFFRYLYVQLSDPARYAATRHEGTGRAAATPYLSVDLFGMTTTNTDDLSIGQVLERAAPYFDFISPMVYPSHYPHGFHGLGNPNEHVYEVVGYSMRAAAGRLAATTTPVESFAHARIGTSTPPVYGKPTYDIQKLRPWLQDFDYGGIYDVAEVRAQIQATYDAGLTSFMVWDPANRYTRGAYLPDTE